MAKGPKRGSKGRVKSSLGSLRLREFRLDALQLADYNPRTISDEALAGLTKSIERFGCVEPIIVNIRGGRKRVVGGHQRIKAMVALGQTTATCVTVSCTDAEERLLNVTLNNSHLQGQFTDALAAMIEELRTQIGDASLLDLRIAELTAGLEHDTTQGGTGDDEVPEPPRKAVTKAGDLWVLGGHRLVCGDSTEADNVKFATDDHLQDMMMTSPPYNVGIKYASYKDRAARIEYLAFIEKVAAQAFSVLRPGRFIAWNIGVSPDTYPAWQIVTLEGIGFTFYRQIVWEKAGIPYPIFPSTMRAKKARHFKPNYKHEIIAILDKPGPHDKPMRCPICEGRGSVIEEPLPLDNEHEIIALMTKGDEPELGGEITPNKSYQNDVWRISQSLATVDLKTVGRVTTRLKKNGKTSHMVKEHPAVYPVELPKALISFLTAQGEVVFDPFLGAGSTIIAAEKLGRRCCGLEIEPRYCDVIVERWQQFTGGKAKRGK